MKDERQEPCRVSYRMGIIRIPLKTYREEPGDEIEKVMLNGRRRP